MPFADCKLVFSKDPFVTLDTETDDNDEGSSTCDKYLISP